MEWKDVQFGSFPRDFEQKREKKRKEQKMYWMRCPLLTEFERRYLRRARRIYVN